MISTLMTGSRTLETVSDPGEAQSVPNPVGEDFSEDGPKDNF